jgi:hypothetical protein
MQRMTLPYASLSMSFIFPFPCERVFEWWTDLQPTGYVGLTLKKMDILKSEGNKTKVLTRWHYLWFSFTMVETLVIESNEKWTWYSNFLGVPAVETFTLRKRSAGCELKINSVMSPTGFRKVLFLLIGWYWRRIDKREWNSAAEACQRELSVTKGSHLPP